MLSENIKALRKAKGLSQEELAVKVNVVRQTISKWEKGLSVPDSEMLIVLAEVLDTSVTKLLGETVESAEEPTLQEIAEKLEALNAQFAQRNEKSRRIKRTLFAGIAVGAAAVFAFCLISWIRFVTQESASIDIIGGADGPTAILVSSTLSRGKFSELAIATLAFVIAAIGWVKNKKK